MGVDILGPTPLTTGIVTLLVLCTCNNTDGNKVVIFSSIALYYGDTYNYVFSEYIGACRPGHARVISKHCALIIQ